MIERDLPKDFERIVQVLNEKRVRYIVIGATAALLQGVPLVRTMDLDVTPASDDENKRRLAEGLRDLNARLRASGLDEPMEIPLDERTFTGMVTMTFTTKYGPFDVCFTPDGTNGFDDLVKDSRTVERFGISIPVASIADIMRSKQAAGRPKEPGL